MPMGLGPAIHDFTDRAQNVDGRHKGGHDEMRRSNPLGHRSTRLGRAFAGALGQRQRDIAHPVLPLDQHQH